MGKMIEFIKGLFNKLFSKFKVKKGCPKCHNLMDEGTSTEGNTLICSKCGYKMLAKNWGKPIPVPKESAEERNKREFEAYLGKLIERGMAEKGLDKESATKWAWKHIEKKMERRREKMGGTPIACSVCHRSGCNAETGPYRKNPDGTYKHQNPNCASVR